MAKFGIPGRTESEVKEKYQKWVEENPDRARTAKAGKIERWDYPPALNVRGQPVRHVEPFRMLVEYDEIEPKQKSVSERKRRR